MGELSPKRRALPEWSPREESADGVVGIVGALFIPVVLSLLGELLGALFEAALPRAARWWAAAGAVTVRLWTLAIGGVLSAIILLVIGIDEWSDMRSTAWLLLLLVVVPGLVGFIALVALVQRAEIGKGYRRSRDGSWSVGQ